MIIPIPRIGSQYKDRNGATYQVVHFAMIEDTSCSANGERAIVFHVVGDPRNLLVATLSTFLEGGFTAIGK